ncbi:hypothetical protein [Pseudactinotalea sp.]|uniref:hypothetical protein n=1 Tax=Pseudactinotalea sp. TaxID=1926260 RepID=UPI003B3BD3E0
MTTQGETAAAADVAACERTFRRYGLPLLIEDHSARRDVFGRAAPLLLVLCLVGIAGAINTDWPAWQNALAVMVAAVGIAAAFAGFNALRGRRWSTLPQDIGGPELAFFVLAPAVPPLLAGWQWGTALVTVAGNLVLLAAIWLVVRYGVHATLWWGVRGGIREVGASLLRLIRFLPLLLIFSIALFYNAEIWQVFDHTPGVSDFVLGGFFAVLILAILRIRLTTETGQILRAASPEQNAPAPLTQPQLANVSMMVALHQLLQVLLVSVAVGVFFFALGTLTITQGVMDAWGIAGGWVQHIQIAGETDLRISQTLLRVSVAIATFTGLYYAISVLTDGLYRDDFIDDMAVKLRDVNEHRARYAAALDRLAVERAS